MWKILIADDEAMERTALHEILTEHFGGEVEVRMVGNGQSAVELALLWNADLILMDIEMPGMNGVEATAAIRKRLPGCRVIFLTAYGRFEYAQEAIRLGVRDYILKPAEDEEVLDAVRKQMALRAAPAVPPPEPAPPKPAQPAQADQAEAAEAETATGRNVRLMQHVQQYLEKNYQQDIALESLSQTLGFSPYYFSKIFKQHFGVTFVEYLTDIRVRAAKELLAGTNRSAKEIGESVGYPNSNYFVTLFKRKTGVTPTEFRSGLV